MASRPRLTSIVGVALNRKMGSGASTEYYGSMEVSPQLTSKQIAKLVCSIGPSYEGYKKIIMSHQLDGKKVSSLMKNEGALIEAMRNLGVTNMIHQKVIYTRLIASRSDLHNYGGAADWKIDRDVEIWSPIGGSLKLGPHFLFYSDDSPIDNVSITPLLETQMEESQCQKLHQLADYVPQSKKSRSPILKRRQLSSLHLACMQNDLLAVKLLAKKGANKEALDDFENTPLHVACSFGLFAIMTWLVEYGSNVTALNIDNCSPVDLALKGGHTDLVVWLTNRAALESIDRNVLANEIYNISCVDISV